MISVTVPNIQFDGIPVDDISFELHLTFVRMPRCVPERKKEKKRKKNLHEKTYVCTHTNEPCISL